jgi:hypothetical protein
VLQPAFMAGPYLASSVLVEVLPRHRSIKLGVFAVYPSGALQHGRNDLQPAAAGRVVLHSSPLPRNESLQIERQIASGMEIR